MSWYFVVLKKYAVFSGRARRKEYWMYNLFDTIIIIALVFWSETADWNIKDVAQYVFLGYFFARLIPDIAVRVRRLHDIDMSGWLCLLGFIPIVGPFIFLFFAIQDGTEGANKYGPDPKHRSLP